MAEANTNFLCKTCGALLEEAVAASTNGLVKCPYCNNVWTVPRQGANPAALSFLRIGENYLDTCKFDDAFTTFQKAAEADKEEPEAYFGMALATFKVQYLKDEVATPPRLQPICHEISGRNFTECKDYLRALELASPAQKAEYRRKGQEIDKIRAEFLRLKESGLDYDCFLCVKVSDENGGTTQDSHDALRLYHYLKDRGYAPFYSEEEIKGRSGADYEALILYALFTSECMLVVCSNEDYLRTKWMKNEYTRFSKMIEREGKESDAITFVFRGKPIEHLPGQDAKIQGIDLTKPDAYSLIEEYISSFRPIPLNGAPELQRKEYSGKAYKKKEVSRHGVAKRELLTAVGGEITVSDRAKLKIANDFLHRNDFGNATRFIDNMLKENSANGEAYWLRFLAELSCVDENDFIGTAREIDFGDFEKAISYAQEDARRAWYYDVLYRRVKSSKDLSSYQEYIELPDSSEAKIAELTEVMFRLSLQNADEAVFDAIIKTVTDTDKYVAMNLEFAHTAEGARGNALKYYRNILSADEGHGEALWKVFAAEHGASDVAVFAYCSGEGLSRVEEALFSYGYNQYAAKQLFALCLNNAKDKTEEACRLFDLVLTMIPKAKNTLFIGCLNEFLDALFRSDRVRFAVKYNELLLHEDKLNHNAYFNRVLIKHNYHNAFELVRLSGHLMEDEDYFSAVNSYAEQFPEAKSNLYLDINDAITSLAATVHSEDCRAFVAERCYITKEKLPECKNRVRDVLDTEAENCLRAVCRENGCDGIDGLFHLRKDVTSDPRLHRALLFAEEAGNSTRVKDIKGVLEEQGGYSRANVETDREAERKYRNGVRKERLYIVSSVAALALAITMIVTLIWGLTDSPSAFEYYLLLFNGLDAHKVVLGFLLVFSMLFALLSILNLAGVFKNKEQHRDRKPAIPIFILVAIFTCVFHGVGLARYTAADDGNSDYAIYRADNYYMVLEARDGGWAVTELHGDLSKVVIPDRYEGNYVTAIGGSVFRETSVAVVQLPAHLKSIGYNAFYQCKDLVSVNIPSTVTSIDGYAFYECSSLRQIYIPTSVKTMGRQVFYNMNGTVYCAAESKPKDWATDWAGRGPTIKWGYTY